MDIGAAAGRVTDPHRFMLAEQPAHPEFLDEAIERLEVEVEKRQSGRLATRARLESASIVACLPRGYRLCGELDAGGICSAIKRRVVSVVRP